MKEIDHDKQEFTRPKWEEWDRQKAEFEKEHGHKLSPGDLARWLAPFFIISISLFLWREGWPY